MRRTRKWCVSNIPMEIILIKIKIVNIFSKINYEMKMWIFFGADLLIDIWWEKNGKWSFSLPILLMRWEKRKCDVWSVDGDDARWPLKKRLKMFSHLYNAIFRSWCDDVVIVWAPCNIKYRSFMSTN